MIVELITTGSELLLGQIVNTNVVYMARELNKIGFDTVYQTTIGDNRERMEEAVRHALTRADIIITSGGLGPTQGDITKEICAEIFKRPLHLDGQIAEHIKQRCLKHGYKMTENNLRMAMIPEGATVFANANGAAPGIVLEHDGRIVINLPGPPREMKDMFQRSLKPYLKEKYGFHSIIVSRVLDTFGIGESLLETKIRKLIDEQYEQHNPTLALLVRPTGVIIRITAKAGTQTEADKIIADEEARLRSLVGDYIYAVDDEGMESAVGSMLREKGLTIACAESCTGGLITSRLTDVPGSSAYVMGSVVSYTNTVKADILGVSQAALQSVGAVSEETACQMAEGIRRVMHTDIGLSATGLAGPDGGTAAKPVGLVYTAVATPQGTKVLKNCFAGTRSEIKFHTSQTALDMVRQALLRDF
jgi:nicotinamide-nucleotide amidase